MVDQVGGQFVSDWRLVRPRPVCQGCSAAEAYADHALMLAQAGLARLLIDRVGGPRVTAAGQLHFLEEELERVKSVESVANAGIPRDVSAVGTGKDQESVFRCKC